MPFSHAFLLRGETKYDWAVSQTACGNREHNILAKWLCLHVLEIVSRALWTDNIHTFRQKLEQFKDTKFTLFFGSNKYYTHLKPLISPHESFEAHSWQCTLNINLCFLWIIIFSFFLDTSIMVPLSKSQPWHFYAKHKPRWSLDNLWNHFIARHPLQLMSPWCCVSFILYNILNEQLCGGSSYGLGIDKSLRRVNGHLFISMIALPNFFSASHNIPLLHLP